MGHYAAEMRHESLESAALRKKYWATREKLEKVPSSAFTVGQLQKVLILLSDDNIPRHFDVSTKNVIKEMKQYTPRRSNELSVE